VLKKQKSSLQQYKHKMKDIGVKWPAKVMKLGKDEELETVLYLCAYIVVLATVQNITLSVI